MQITVNALELASELADKKLKETHSLGIYVLEENEVRYTEQAQDLFNQYYDEYLELIQNCEE
jgi:hypothetical protein